ncbi:hypothetical protein [Goekera deserti]|uniref:hypothetical protein n=1 Tax=Goekera deserti TaxID=2497753 RepID=UPI001F465F06|nr:hypothetical protein [Goekera deserti]
MPVLSRVLGVATAGFGVLEFARPDLYGTAAGLGPPSRALRTLHHTLGVRDVVIGVGMTLAPAGTPLRTVTAVRVFSDLTDAVAFGLNAPADKRAKSLAVALGYAGLCALSLRWADR